MKTLIAALGVLLLAGCTATFFETPPLASQGCDPKAVGSWLSVPEKSDAEGEHSRLRIDAGCRLVVEEIRNGMVKASAPVPLHLGQHAGEHYAWFDANWTLHVGRAGSRVEATDVVLVRYALRGKRLRIWQVNDEAVDRLHREGKLVRKYKKPGEHETFRWITGPANPELLELDGLFFDEPREFTRERGQP